MFDLLVAIGQVDEGLSKELNRLVTSVLEASGVRQQMMRWMRDCPKKTKGNYMGCCVQLLGERPREL